MMKRLLMSVLLAGIACVATADIKSPAIIQGGTAGSVPFSGVTSGTNTNTLTVGSGGSITTSGTGNIDGRTPTNFALNWAVGPGSIAIASAGTGYAAGDTITLTCTGANFTTNPVAVVAAVTTGAITSIQLPNPGLATVVGPTCGTMTQSTTSGSGTGATFTVAFGPVAANLSLPTLTTGGGVVNGNTYIGGDSVASGLYGSENTFLGDRAGQTITGYSIANTAVGHSALGPFGATAPSGADYNTFVGDDSGRNVSGAVQSNTGIGQNSCRNIASNGNTCIGQGTLGGAFPGPVAITGGANTAVGFNSMSSTLLTSAQLNSSLGANALDSMTTGSSNVSVGYNTLIALTTGAGHTAVGANAGDAMVSGFNGTFIGENAGLKVTGNYNTVLGNGAASTTLTTGASNVVIGDSANCDTTASSTSNEIDICTSSTPIIKATNGGTPSTSATSIAGTLALPAITTGTNADFVCMTSGLVFVIQSSACTISSLRFKDGVTNHEGSAVPEIAHMEVADFNLKPTGNRDPNATTRQTGLIAENIAQVAPECAIYEDDMKTPKSYRQECVIALLVKAVQEQSHEIAYLKARHYH